VRYTGWTVPSYNQSQQQYGYTGNTYNMGNYPQQGQAQGYYGGQVIPGGGPGYNSGTANAYYDATRAEPQSKSPCKFELTPRRLYSAYLSSTC
jgi:hypothetical protein